MSTSPTGDDLAMDVDQVHQTGVTVLAQGKQLHQDFLMLGPQVRASVAVVAGYHGLIAGLRGLETAVADALTRITATVEHQGREYVRQAREFDQLGRASVVGAEQVAALNRDVTP